MTGSREIDVAMGTNRVAKDMEIRGYVHDMWSIIENIDLQDGKTVDEGIEITILVIAASTRMETVYVLFASYYWTLV
jgi:hypothetical protein